MEIPKPPQSLVDRLKESDPTLGLRFSVDEQLWEVTETLRSNGVVSHVFFWHEGPWSARVFKQLPLTADPILAKLAAVDWAKGRGNPKQKYRDMVNRGAEARARGMEKANQIARERLREFTGYMQRNFAGLSRLHKLGGASRDRAVRSRVDAIREILYDGKLPGEV